MNKTILEMYTEWLQSDSYKDLMKNMTDVDILQKAYIAGWQHAIEQAAKMVQKWK